MDAAKQYEWVKYVAESTLISDKAAREAEMLNRLLKLKYALAEVYGPDEAKWRPLYLAMKEKIAKKEIEYRGRLLAQAQVRAAVTAPLVARAVTGRALTAEEAAIASRAAVFKATADLASKYGAKKRRRRNSRRSGGKRRNTRKNR